jgi:hypothetical protein
MWFGRSDRARAQPRNQCKREPVQGLLADRSDVQILRFDFRAAIG